MRPLPSPIDVRILSVLLLAGPALGCAGDAGPSASELEDFDVVIEEAGKADALPDVRVRAGETTLWFDSMLARERRDGAESFVLRGRASRNVEDGLGFVMDDPHGDFEVVSARTFAVRYPVGAAQTLAPGGQHFVRVGFVPSATRPSSVTARFTAGYRLVDFEGTGAYVRARLDPVYVNGAIVHRLRATVASNVREVSAQASGLPRRAAIRLDATHFAVDFGTQELLAIAGTDTKLELIVNTATSTRTKSANVAIVLERLGATTGDAYEDFPAPECTSDVRRCVDELDGTTTDFSSCGEGLVVALCVAASAPRLDEAAMQRGLAYADALTTPASALGRAASALVGASREVAFLDAVRRSAEYQLELNFGRVFASPLEREAAIRAIVDATVARAYARPLELVDALAPLPGDGARARDVAADALLAHLASLDLRMTEWRRPLEELTTTFRERHLASLRELRTSVEPVRYGEGLVDVYIVDWLDALVEVRIVPETGAVESLLLEID